MKPEKPREFFSTMVLKAIDEEKRILEGTASTPSTDRMGDVVDPEGMEFKLPFPFLYQHNSRQPIGQVLNAKVNKSGMFIQAKILDQSYESSIPWLREAWGLIKTGLVRGLSIGFRSLEDSYDRETQGFHFLRTEIMEVSAVTIPANQEASITSVKSAWLDLPAALGHKAESIIRFANPINPSGASEKSHRGNMRTIEEQIAALEAKRQANVGRQETVRTKAADEGRVMDKAEGEEFDTLSTENQTIDEELARLKRHQKQISEAISITPKNTENQEAATRTRGSIQVIGPANQEKGMAFVRFAMALAASKGDRQLAYDMVRANKTWRDTTPQVEKFLSNPQAFLMAKEAVAAGNTTTSGWASQLADYTWMASEFIEYLRPRTLIGRIQGLRRVPFNIKVPTQTAGSTVNWVGQGLAKPVTKLTFNTATLAFSKVAGIIVLTEELVRFSNPSAEALCRADLAAAIIQFLDEQFLDPTVTAVANVSPASITQGAGNAGATGGQAVDFRNDLQLAIQQMITANIDVAGVNIIMQPGLALAMSLMRNDLGNKEFPDLTVNGGMLEGFTCLTAQSCASGIIVFVQPSEIMLADDGNVSLDVSREATITMDDGVSPVVTTAVNLWQNNLIGLRAEREINWRRRRDAAVYYISSAAYSAASPA